MTNREDQHRQFGRELRRLRMAKGLSRPGLSGVTGKCPQTIAKHEGTNPPQQPRRETVIVLAVGVGMDPDRALGMFGYDPMTASELVAYATPTDAWAKLLSLKQRLSPRAHQVLLNIAELLIAEKPSLRNTSLDGDDPLSTNGGRNDGVGYVRMEFKPGAAERIRREQREHSRAR